MSSSGTPTSESSPHGTTSEDVGDGTAHRAGAFDIRNFIGALIGIYGVVLTVMGLLGPKASQIAKAGGVNINLWAGLGMVVVAAGFLVWARLRPVIVPEHVEHGAGGTGLVVPRAQDHPGHAGQDDPARAHRAGLEGHHQRAAVQPPRAQGPGGLAQRQDLGVGGGVAVGLPAVAAPADHRPVRADVDGADRHVLRPERRPGLGDGQPHPLLRAGLGAGARGQCHAVLLLGRSAGRAGSRGAAAGALRSAGRPSSVGVTTRA